MSTSSRRRGVVAVTAAFLAISIVGCAAVDSATPSASPPTPRELEQAPALEEALDTFLSDAGATVPGVIARVITPDGTWTGAAGTASAGREEEITPGMHTRVGSITKTMTATLLLQLVQDGELSLDDPVGDYLPDIVNPQATLRQVADMTSGIPSYTLSPQWQAEAFGDPERAWTPQELVDAANSLPASFAPGDGWEYSNTNYVVLGLIIEEVTEQPIADVFEERLFAPLGMDDSEFAVDATFPDPHLDGITAQGQAAGQTADATDWSPTISFTAGQVISTLDDLELWAHALFTGEGVLDPETQQLRRDSILTSPPPNTETSGYGLGFGDRDGWWGHTGEIPGFNTVVMHSYDEATTILVIVNSDVPLASGESPAPAAFAALQAALR